MILLFDIGFLPVRLLDILDILIVGFLIYQIYKLLRGTIAFNIFIGVILIYAVWWLVKGLQMDLLSLILGQIVSMGLIILIIIFQPEVRRFLLILGNSTLRQRSNFFSRLLDKNLTARKEEQQQYILEIKKAILRLQKTKSGALIVFTDETNLDLFSSSGTILKAEISQLLLESIFNKNSPLHDGAVIISGNKIYAASCILPISSRPDIPKYYGLRHRAALGITEHTDVRVFIISEERGHISFAYQGEIKANLTETMLMNLLVEHYI